MLTLSPQCMVLSVGLGGAGTAYVLPSDDEEDFDIGELFTVAWLDDIFRSW